MLTVSVAGFFFLFFFSRTLFRGIGVVQSLMLTLSLSCRARAQRHLLPYRCLPCCPMTLRGLSHFFRLHGFGNKHHICCTASRVVTLFESRVVPQHVPRSISSMEPGSGQASVGQLHSGSSSFPGHSPTCSYQADGEDDVFDIHSSTTREVSSCPQSTASVVEESGAGQWHRAVKNCIGGRRTSRRVRTSKEDCFPSPSGSADTATLKEVASILQQQQRVLDDLTTNVQDLRVDVRKQTSVAAACRTRPLDSAAVRHNAWWLWWLCWHWWHWVPLRTSGAAAVPPRRAQAKVVDP